MARSEPGSSASSLCRAHRSVPNGGVGHRGERSCYIRRAVFRCPAFWKNSHRFRSRGNSSRSSLLDDGFQDRCSEFAKSLAQLFAATGLHLRWHCCDSTTAIDADWAE